MKRMQHSSEVDEQADARQPDIKSATPDKPPPSPKKPSSDEKTGLEYQLSELISGPPAAKKSLFGQNSEESELDTKKCGM